jgi:hypothetical protein
MCRYANVVIFCLNQNLQNFRIIKSFAYLHI